MERNTYQNTSIYENHGADDMYDRRNDVLQDQVDYTVIADLSGPEVGVQASIDLLTGAQSQSSQPEISVL